MSYREIAIEKEDIFCRSVAMLKKLRLSNRQFSPSIFKDLENKIIGEVALNGLQMIKNAEVVFLDAWKPSAEQSKNLAKTTTIDTKSLELFPLISNVISRSCSIPTSVSSIEAIRALGQPHHSFYQAGRETLTWWFRVTPAGIGAASKIFVVYLTHQGLVTGLLDHQNVANDQDYLSDSGLSYKDEMQIIWFHLWIWQLAKNIPASDPVLVTYWMRHLDSECNGSQMDERFLDAA